MKRTKTEDVKKAIGVIQSWLDELSFNLDNIMIVNKESGLRNTVLSVFLKVVEKHTEITRGEILGARRTPKIVTARQIFIKVAKDAGYTCVEIGKCLNRDYSTIIYSLKKFEDYYATEADFKVLADKIKEECGQLH